MRVFYIIITIIKNPGTKTAAQTVQTPGNFLFTAFFQALIYLLAASMPPPQYVHRCPNSYLPFASKEATNLNLPLFD